MTAKRIGPPPAPVKIQCQWCGAATARKRSTKRFCCIDHARKAAADKRRRVEQPDRPPLPDGPVLGLKPGGPRLPEDIFVELRERILTEKLSWSAKLVAMGLLLEAREGNILRVGEPRLAELLGIGRYAVPRAKVKLRQAGLLNWTLPRGASGRALYRFLDHEDPVASLGEQIDASAAAP